MNTTLARQIVPRTLTDLLTTPDDRPAPRRRPRQALTLRRRP